MRILNLLLAGLLAAAPLAAPTRVMAAPKAPESQAEMLSLMREVTGWLGPSSALIGEVQSTWGQILDGINRATEDDVTGAAGEAWAEAWVKEMDARLADLKARSAALAPMPADLIARYRTLGPSAAGQIQGFQKMRQAAQQAVNELDGFYATLRPLILAAASGDEEARFALLGKAISGVRLALKADNRQLEVGIASASPADHPQATLARSVLESNAALDLPFAYVEAMIDPEAEEPDAMTFGKSMMGHIERSRAYARKVAPDAERVRARSLKPVEDGPLKAVIERAFATYRESADIELKINDLLERMARDLMSGEDFDVETWPFEELDKLAVRRGELQAERERHINGH